MNFNKYMPVLFLGMSVPLMKGCNKVSKAVELPAIQKIEKESKFHEIVSDTFSVRMSDKTKVIEFNKLLSKYGQIKENYIIVDKKQCNACVYSPDGNLLYKTEVALGRQKSDVRGGGYKNKKAKQTFATTPGEYYVGREGAIKGSTDERLYGERVLILKGDHTRQDSRATQTLALHRVPATPMGKLRESVFNNGTLKDNRVSFGCVNFLVRTFDKMRNLITGKNTKVYILPEEKGNSLYLEKQANGKYKFFQKKYRYESQE